jgi:hypothetical protein
MLNRKIKLIPKVDPLKYLLEKVVLTSRIDKWVMILSEFDFEYVDRNVIKGQVIVDQLVDTPLEDHEPLSTEFLDEGILTLELSNH